MNSYAARSDAELALMASDDDQAAFACLFGRYNAMMHAKAVEKSRVCGVDITDDMAQEAAIGFLHAVRSFDPSKGARFRTYAEKCVDNVLTSAVRSYLSGKNAILNNSVLLSGAETEFGMDSQDILDARDVDSAFMSRLSGLERAVAELRVKGLTYEETAASLGISLKSVDNAIQRIRQKYRASKRS
ncbi:MAG: sigma-70 family RNA polymerase sigma factor [Clostridia bacterium]|nr:sigma-70 family RNA polymerase sigma factor [Clostridia bacterium]